MKELQEIHKFSVLLCGFSIILNISAVCSHFLDRTGFVIMSQRGHDTRAENTREELRNALRTDGVKDPHIKLLHKDLPYHGGWTVFPILAPLLDDYADLIDWFVFLDEVSAVDPKILTKLLSAYDSDRNVFLGKALQDQDSVIIHHYNQNLDFKYPNFAASFVLSARLVDTIVKELKAKNFQVENFPKDFSIGI